MSRRRWVHTAVMTAVLVAFMAIWSVSVGGVHPVPGLVLFPAAFVIFKLMNRFELTDDDRG